MTSAELTVFNIHDQQPVNRLKNMQYETVWIDTLLTHNDTIGLINCYSSKCLDFSAEDQLLLSTIAMQASLAIQNHLLLDAPRQVNSTRTFFDDLLSGKPEVEESLRGRAASLGCDLTTPHVMIMLAMVQMLESHGHGETTGNSKENQVSAFRRTVKLAQRRIQGNYPGSLLDERENIPPSFGNEQLARLPRIPCQRECSRRLPVSDSGSVDTARSDFRIQILPQANPDGIMTTKNTF